MRFYWQDKHTKDVRYGARLSGLLHELHRPKKCLILTQEADEYMEVHGMGAYIAYKVTMLKPSLTPKGIVEVVENYPEVVK